MSYIGIPPFGQTIRTITNVTATASQTTFNITGGYIVGYVDVYLNGVLLTPSDYTATDGLTVVLGTGAALNDEFQAISYQPVSLTNALPTVGGTLTGDVTTTANINFGDNDKAQFGASNDLEIYHNGSHSLIDNNTGNLYILTDGTTYFANSANSENYATFNQNGAVTLYYDNSAKLATASTGVDVTGDIASSTGFFKRDSNNYVYVGASSYIGSVVNGSERMRITSAGNVGIGTTSPTELLDVTSSSAQISRFTSTSAANNNAVVFETSGSASSINLWFTNSSSNASSLIRGHDYLSFHTGGTNTGGRDSATERMRIDSSGNVGINNSNPDQYISSADTVLNITGSAVNTSPATLSMNGSSTILGRDFATTQVFGVNVSNTATEITRITGTSSNGFRMMVRITTSGHTGGVGNSSIYAMYYWDGGTGTPQQIFRYDSGASLGLSFDNSTSNVFIIKLASAGAAGSYQGTFMVEWFVPQDFAGGTWTIS